MTPEHIEELDTEDDTEPRRARVIGGLKFRGLAREDLAGLRLTSVISEVLFLYALGC